MARIAVLFSTTLQAWQGQSSAPATATGNLCPDWKSNIRTFQCSQTKSPPTLLTATRAVRKDKTSGISFKLQPYSLTLPDTVKKEESVCQPISQDLEKHKELFFVSFTTSSVSETSCKEGKKKAALEHGWHTDRESNKKRSLSCASMGGYSPHIFTLFTSSTLFSLIFFFYILADAFISQSITIIILKYVSMITIVNISLQKSSSKAKRINCCSSNLFRATNSSLTIKKLA